MITIGQRIKQSRINLNLSQLELSKLCGWEGAHGRIGHYEKNRREPSARDIHALAKALKVTPEWLMFGVETGPLPDNKNGKTLDIPINGLSFTTIKHHLPFISWNEIGTWLNAFNYVDKKEIFMSDKSLLPCVLPIGNSAFALPVRNDSMVSYVESISFEVGSIIFVDPDKKYESGNFVVALIPGAEEAILRKYTEEGGKKYLIPLNPRYPTIELSKKIKIYGTIVGQYQAL